MLCLFSMLQPPEALNGCKPLYFLFTDHHDFFEYDRASRRKASLISRIFFLTPLALIMGNIFATILLTKASLANYPGGQALAVFHQLFSNNTRMQFILNYISMVSLSSSVHPFSHTPYPHIQFSSSKRCLPFPSTALLSSLLPSTYFHYP